MALVFTYRLTAQAPRASGPSLQHSGADLHRDPGLASPGSSRPWPPAAEVDPQPVLAPGPDLLDQGAIGTIHADPAQRPDSGLGFSCLDLLAGSFESGP